MREPVPETFTLFARLPEADIFYDRTSATVLIITKINFIPIEAFKAVFARASALMEEKEVNRVIFDKRSLTIFHQPSMEWYYLDWKQRMFNEHRLSRHDKILPKDELFRNSVARAREQIFKANPGHTIQKIKAVYFNNIQEALD